MEIEVPSIRSDMVQKSETCPGRNGRSRWVRPTSLLGISRNYEALSSLQIRPRSATVDN